MQYINYTILCLEGYEFIQPSGIVPEGTYKSLQQRGKITVHGRGGNGRQVLIEYETLPPAYKALVVEKYGDPYEYASMQPLRTLMSRINPKAIDFFDNYVLPDGRLLPDDHKREYIKASGIMGMIDYVYDNKKWLKKELKVELTKFWI